MEGWLVVRSWISSAFVGAIDVKSRSFFGSTVGEGLHIGAGSPNVGFMEMNPRARRTLLCMLEGVRCEFRLQQRS